MRLAFLLTATLATLASAQGKENEENINPKQLEDANTLSESEVLAEAVQNQEIITNCDGNEWLDHPCDPGKSCCHVSATNIFVEESLICCETGRENGCCDSEYNVQDDECTTDYVSEDPCPEGEYCCQRTYGDTLLNIRCCVPGAPGCCADANRSHPCKPSEDVAADADPNDADPLPFCGGQATSCCIDSQGKYCCLAGDLGCCV